MESVLDKLATWYPLLAMVAAYLLGSLSFAVIVSRAMGLSDPRTVGSKNPGATNVLRSGNKGAAVATLLLDGLKGWLPVALVGGFGPPDGLGDGTVALVGIAAFVGHVYPVFFKFEGGKGVATALGVLMGVSWVLGLATVATWLIVVYFLRFVSLASVLAAVFAPVYFIFGDGVAWSMGKETLLAMVLMSAMLVWRHSANLSRLVKGTEPRLGKRQSDLKTWPRR
jgi:glycerol-3-phosphate acyltransferase PlsY